MGGSSALAGGQDAAGGFGNLVQAVVERPETLGLPGFEAGLQPGNPVQRAPESQHVARPRRAERDPGEQPLDVENVSQTLPQFGAQNGLLQELAHRVQPLADLGRVHRGPQQSLAKQPASHARKRSVQRGEQGGFGLRASSVG
jgi:hypothetical protein